MIAQASMSRVLGLVSLLWSIPVSYFWGSSTTSKVVANKNEVLTFIIMIFGLHKAIQLTLRILAN